jgi:uncharacterized protein with HEPN domain
MKQPDDSAYLEHMLDAALRLIEIRNRESRESLDEDIELQWSVFHGLQIIGEAARKLSTSVRSQDLDIPWTQVIGMRHKIVHDYSEVDTERVWFTLEDDLEPLIAALRTLLREKRGDEDS